MTGMGSEPVLPLNNNLTLQFIDIWTSFTNYLLRHESMPNVDKHFIYSYYCSSLTVVIISKPWKHREVLLLSPLLAVLKCFCRPASNADYESCFAQHISLSPWAMVESNLREPANSSFFFLKIAFVLQFSFFSFSMFSLRMGRKKRKSFREVEW